MSNELETVVTEDTGADQARRREMEIAVELVALCREVVNLTEEQRRLTAAGYGYKQHARPEFAAARLGPVAAEYVAKAAPHMEELGND